MPFTFTAAQAADLDAVLAIVRSVVGTKYSHWDEEYPSEELLAGDIARGELYILREDGRPTGVISILAEVGDNIVEFPWPEPLENTCLLARFAIIPEAQGRGLAAKVMHYAAETAREKGFSVARLFTNEDNPITNHIYQKLGYRTCGRATLWEEEYVGYDLKL